MPTYFSNFSLKHSHARGKMTGMFRFRNGLQEINFSSYEIQKLININNRHANSIPHTFGYIRIGIAWDVRREI